MAYVPSPSPDDENDTPDKSIDTVDAVLSAALRGAGTIASLVQETGFPAHTVEGAVEVLSGRGWLIREGSRLLACAPTDHLRVAVAERMRHIQDALEGIDEEFVSLSDQLQEWMLGRRLQSGEFSLEVLGGAHLIRELWSGRFSVRVPEQVRLMADGLDLIRAFRIPELDDAEAFIRQHALAVRCLLPASARQNREQEDSLIAPSVQLRVTGEERTWFMVHDDTLVVPLSPDAGLGGNVLVITAQPLAALAARSFDDVWSRAQPVPTTEQGWGPLLRLLAEGLTVESAARILGLSERTARRRIAEAMSHHRVEGLFALGMAWQRRESDGSSVGGYA